MSIDHCYPGSQDASQTLGAGFFTCMFQNLILSNSRAQSPFLLVPCASVPDVSLTFGGTAFPISADTFNLGQVAVGSPDCVGGITGEDGIPCMSVLLS